ncbi:MAG: serine protease [Vicinamibacterales bacterium]
MSWSDIGEIQASLERALAAYDGGGAQRICDALVRRIRTEAEVCGADAAGAVLAALRRKRRFDLAGRVAEAFVLSGQNAPRIRRHYAQALIDQGFLLAAEPVLFALASEPLEDDTEAAEAHGLFGRIYKQRYVESAAPGNARARAFFERALAEYLQTYRCNPARHYWHGVNVVALLHRARADGIPVEHAPDPDGVARAILATLRQAPETAEPFALATRLEAHLSLREYAEAEAAALEYSRHPGADAFEFASTLRQLEEVWRLHDATPPGATILPILRAARLCGEKGALAATPSNVDTEIARTQHARAELERIFGADKTVTLQWYETGLLRTKSVARVERLDGKGHGTGWLVDAADFFPSVSGTLLLTNAHVINAEGTGGALAPDQAQANFQGIKTVLELGRVIWSSPPDRLDATFVTFRDAGPAVAPLPLSTRKLRLGVPPPRLYIIGHPAGRDLELSLHDNKLLACSESLLHYRTPTEGGSSGSPVFEETGWKVVALHHAGGWYEGIDGNTPPPYEANEGIPILAVQQATRQTATAAPA